MLYLEICKFTKNATDNSKNNYKGYGNYDITNGYGYYKW